MRPLNSAELGSSVLIVAHPRPGEVSFGADFADDFVQARELCAERDYPVIAMPAEASSGRESANAGGDAQSALEFLRASSAAWKKSNEKTPLEKDSELPADVAWSATQLIVIEGEASPEAVRGLINEGNAFRVLRSFDDASFERTVQEALEEHALAKQNKKLLQLVSEQNARLQKLSTELEERVEKRERHLQESREVLVVANSRVEALHRALIAVHRARSSAEMERLINEALVGAIGLDWTRIAIGPKATSGKTMRQAQAKLFSIQASPLLRGKESLGEIIFARGPDRPFARDESHFLEQIAEAVALAIDRLAKLGQSETLKAQWEATFDAIDEPVAIVDSNRAVARMNRAFARAAGLKSEALIGRKCHEALFGKAEPCDGCALGNNFRLSPAKTADGQNPIYQVFSQAIGDKPVPGSGARLETPSREAAYVNMYRDVAPQLRIESQLVESAKMAELGTIGSSIAHELNNPLGGMLSFLQLMKMDLKGDEPWREDVEEMEKGARRCRDIVQNLLGFARKSEAEGDGEVDLREVARQAMKIAELQTRAMGVLATIELPDKPTLARGQFNLLAQAFRFFLQSAQQSIAARARKEAAGAGPGTLYAAGFRGEIALRIFSTKAGSEIEISDNGWRPDRAFAGSERPETIEGADKVKISVANTTSNAAPEARPDFSALDLSTAVALEIVGNHGGTAKIERSSPFGGVVKISFPHI